MPSLALGFLRVVSSRQAALAGRHTPLVRRTRTRVGLRLAAMAQAAARILQRRSGSGGTVRLAVLIISTDMPDQAARDCGHPDPARGPAGHPVRAGRVHHHGRAPHQAGHSRPGADPAQKGFSFCQMLCYFQLEGAAKCVVPGLCPCPYFRNAAGSLLRAAGRHAPWAWSTWQGADVQPAVGAGHPPASPC